MQRLQGIILYRNSSFITKLFIYQFYVIKIYSKYGLIYAIHCIQNNAVSNIYYKQISLLKITTADIYVCCQGKNYFLSFSNIFANMNKYANNILSLVRCSGSNSIFLDHCILQGNFIFYQIMPVCIHKMSKLNVFHTIWIMATNILQHM